MAEAAPSLRCPACRYDLAGLDAGAGGAGDGAGAAVCPECGAGLDWELIRRGPPERRGTTLALLFGPHVCFAALLMGWRIGSGLFPWRDPPGAVNMVLSALVLAYLLAAPGCATVAFHRLEGSGDTWTSRLSAAIKGLGWSLGLWALMFVFAAFVLAVA